MRKDKQLALLQKFGSWAVVTGASSGIGRAIAVELADAGFNLVLVGRNEEALAELSDQLKHEKKIATRNVIADLSTYQGQMLVISESQGLNIGLFVASAGFGTSGNFLESNLTDELEMVRVNCEAVLVLSYYFGKKFAEKGKGGIILLSSIVAFQGVPFAANYSATKAYVQSFGEALSIELKEKGVDVLLAAPGPVSSGFASRANMQMGNAMDPNKVAQPILMALGNKSSIYPGTLTKLLFFGLAFLPRFGKVWVMKNVMGGFTKHHRENGLA